MNVSELVPNPSECETFRRSRLRFVPETPGCYVLTNFSGVVLYIGLTNKLQRRMCEHLDSTTKIAETIDGRAVLFHWIETEEMNKIERTWLNTHIQFEGRLPLLNKLNSPILG